MVSTLDVETLQNIIILLFLTVVILGYMLNTSNKKYTELTHVINKMSLTPLGPKLPNF
tara:strand:+ start:963 stop:1136 length:174 start_codon:yes stop_codon:yes gene_type:complete